MTIPNESINSFKYDDGYGDNGTTTGLTKREYFASMAMSALIIRGSIGEKYIAEQSVKYADVLINELNK